MANKLRFNENYGLDLDQVIGWKRVPTLKADALLPKDYWNLEVYIPGDKMTFVKGEEGFDYLLKTLCTGCGFQQVQDTI